MLKNNMFSKTVTTLNFTSNLYIFRYLFDNAFVQYELVH